MNTEVPSSNEFDFQAHAEAAVGRFRTLRPNYELLADVAKRVLGDTLGSQ
jgi:hypothetical protein